MDPQNPQPQIDPQAVSVEVPVAPQTPEPKKGSALNTIAKILLLISFLALAAYFVGTFVSNKKVVSIPTPTVSSEPLVQATTTPSAPTIIENSNGWKTFISPNKYQFSFPGSWEVDKNKYTTPGNIILNFIDSGQDYYFSTGIDGHDGPMADKVTEEKITIDKISFTKRVWFKNNLPFIISVSPEALKLRYSNYLFDHIEFAVPANNNLKYLEIFDQILSTFKFTN